MIINSLIKYLTSFFVDKEMRFIYRNNLKGDIELFLKQLFWRNPDKKTKACSIYKTEKNYKIITMYSVVLEDEPVFVLPLNVGVEKLHNTIFKAINASKFISTKQYNSKRYSTKDYLNMLKEKSLNNLYKKSTHCCIYLKNSVLEICPSKYSERYKCFEPDSERNLKIEYSKENELKITNEVVKILNN